MPLPIGPCFCSRVCVGTGSSDVGVAPSAPIALALLRAHGLSPHLSRRRLWSATPLTPSRPVGACRPLLPKATTPARTCPNRSGRWPLGPACLQPLRQLRPGLTLCRLFPVRCASLPCRMIIAWLRGANTAFASPRSVSTFMRPPCLLCRRHIVAPLLILIGVMLCVKNLQLCRPMTRGLLFLGL
jgi:hypothetical protein